MKDLSEPIVNNCSKDMSLDIAIRYSDIDRSGLLDLISGVEKGFDGKACQMTSQAGIPMAGVSGNPTGTNRWGRS